MIVTVISRNDEIEGRAGYCSVYGGFDHAFSRVKERFDENTFVTTGEWIAGVDVGIARDA